MNKPIVMISQPMRNRTKAEIEETRNNAITLLESKGYEVMDSYFSEEWKDLHDKEVKHIPLWFLAKALECMAECDAVYFCEGWEKTRGCLIEHNAAAAYGLEMFYGETK